MDSTSNSRITEIQREVASCIARIVSIEGIQNTAIPSLRLARMSAETDIMHFVYEPCLVFIIQGSKTVILGNEIFHCNPLSYLLASVHLPIAGRIIHATRTEPYLCVKLSVNPEQIIDIMQESDEVPVDKKDTQRGLLMNTVQVDVLDALLRLVRLLAVPRDIPMLAPLIIREILYRVLQDEQGYLVKRFALIGRHAQCIAKAIQSINRDFAKPLRVEDLAKSVSMSVSSLHSSFKKITAMSPVQYQKRIRLQEARRLLLTEALSAEEISFQVGYESPSQFSREYARMFGLPPISDIKQLRDSFSSDFV